jgi:hypothetical protein
VFACSRRLPAHREPNRLSRVLAALGDRRRELFDLTEANPTRVGLQYPPDLLDGLGDEGALVYEPEPLGLAAAREAVAWDCRRRGASIDPGDVVLTASTSEAYSWLFKLLCDPGDAVLVPRPGYPLFEHLTRLESVRCAPYDLRYDGRWEIDLDSVGAAPTGTRAVVLVSPNNPTGSYVSPQELAAILGLCRHRGWALVADEVFADYHLESDRPITDVAAQADVLAFTLGGASKTLGLPQIKLGWMIAGGPPAARREALEGLAIVADAYLSVGTPVQRAAAALFRRGASIREAIAGRVRSNLQRAREIARAFPSCEILRAEGGWSAALRIPATRPEESFVIELVEREGVLVHPGYFFDFPHEAFVVVSLLPHEAVFAEAFERVLRLAEAPPS